MAVAYLRVSTDDQKLGPDAQRVAIEAWAARGGVRVAAWFCDQGVSGGAPIAKRPKLLEALASLRVERAGTFVVAKRDRLARDVMAAAMIEQLTERVGAAIVSVAGEGTSDDEDDPAAKLMRRMVDAFAEYERALIAARTAAALSLKKGRNERVGSLPYGKALAEDGKHLVDRADETLLLARIAELHAAGLSLRRIVEQLTTEGRLSRVGTPLKLRRVALLVTRLREEANKQ